MYSLLRTVLDTCKAKLAVAFNPHSPTRQFVVASRTYVCAHSAVDTIVGGGEVFLAPHEESYLGVDTRALEECLVLFALLLCHLLVPLLMSVNVGGNLLQVFGYVLVYLHLLVHVEVGQPVIHHDKRCDIVKLISRLLGDVIPYLHRTALTIAVCQDGEEIVGLQSGFLDKLPHHIRRHVSIYRINDTYLVGLDLKLLLAHQLGYAEHLSLLACQFAGNIQAIARSREIQHHPLSPRAHARGESDSLRRSHHHRKCRTAHHFQCRAP